MIRLNESLIRILAGFLVEIDKADSNIGMELQGTQKSQNNLEKE